jgi:hypothetical protein
LNAMTTPQFITWLDAKMAEYGSGKLIPPAGVLDAELAKALDKQVRADLTEQILREGNFEPRVAAAIAATKTPKAPTLEKDTIKQLFKREPNREWRDHIKAVVANLKNRKGGKQKLNRLRIFKNRRKNAGLRSATGQQWGARALALIDRHMTAPKIRTHPRPS